MRVVLIAAGIFALMRAARWLWRGMLADEIELEKELEEEVRSGRQERTGEYPAIDPHAADFAEEGFGPQ